MIDLDYLIEKEQEAVKDYQDFLNQSVKNPKIISVIKHIQSEEKHHERELKKLKELRAV